MQIEACSAEQALITILIFLARAPECAPLCEQKTVHAGTRTIHLQAHTIYSQVLIISSQVLINSSQVLIQW